MYTVLHHTVEYCTSFNSLPDSHMSDGWRWNGWLYVYFQFPTGFSLYPDEPTIVVGEHDLSIPYRILTYKYYEQLLRCVDNNTFNSLPDSHHRLSKYLSDTPNI